jgi:hypothetical protein
MVSHRGVRDAHPSSGHGKLREGEAGCGAVLGSQGSSPTILRREALALAWSVLSSCRGIRWEWLVARGPAVLGAANGR